jgi:hypothetical protein
MSVVCTDFCPPRPQRQGLLCRVSGRFETDGQDRRNFSWYKFMSRLTQFSPAAATGFRLKIACSPWSLLLVGEVTAWVFLRKEKVSGRYERSPHGSIRVRPDNPFGVTKREERHCELFNGDAGPLCRPGLLWAPQSCHLLYVSETQRAQPVQADRICGLKAPNPDRSAPPLSALAESIFP